MTHNGLIVHRSSPTYFYIGGPECIFTVVIQGEETVLIPCKTKEIAKKYFTEQLDVFLDEEMLTKDDVKNFEDNQLTYNECINQGVFCCDEYNYNLTIHENRIYEK